MLIRIMNNTEINLTDNRQLYLYYTNYLLDNCINIINNFKNDE